MPRPKGSDAEMHIWLMMKRTLKRVPGNGWPVLMWDGSLADRIHAGSPT